MAYGFNPDRSKALVYTKEEIDQIDLENDQALAQEVADRQAAVAAVDTRVSTILAEQDLDPNKDNELVDIRTGYDGVVYSTAGDAVRAQSGDLGENLKYEFNHSLHDGYWNADGSANAATSNGEVKSNIFPVDNASVVVLSVLFSEVYNNWCACIFFDSSNAPISRPSKTINNTSSYINRFAVPEGAKYASVMFRAFGADPDYDVYVYGSSRNELTKEFTLNENSGYINWRGDILEPDVTRQEKYTDLIPVENVKSFIVGLMQPRIPNSGEDMWLAYATYGASGNFMEIISVPLYTTNAWSMMKLVSVDESVKYVSFTYRSYGKYKPVVYLEYEIELISKNIELALHDSKPQYLAMKPCYDHLFVNRNNNNCTIPHESIYHIRLSRSLGFDVIEANVHQTSDGVYLVNHLASGKFGGYFHHVDNETDISGIDVSSVTWEWIEDNVRYNSNIEKYQTRPCTLEEFLAECRQQNLKPFVTTSDSDVVPIVEGYMGKDNYIAYGASREDCPSATIYHWVTKTTKQDVVNYCKNIGKPFIYGMANPADFTIDELRDIVDTLHELGFLIGCSYQDNWWHRYSYVGFDFIGTQTLINRIGNGSICNFHTMFGFDDFTVTNATEANAVLTFSSQGTITPNIPDNIYELCGIDLEISFSGTVTLAAIGERNERAYSSDGSYPVFICVPILNGSPKFMLTCEANTIINDISFKASEF